MVTTAASRVSFSTRPSAQHVQRGAILTKNRPQDLAFPALRVHLHLVKDKQLAPPAMEMHSARKVKQRARSRLHHVQVERSQTLLHLHARLVS